MTGPLAPQSWFGGIRERTHSDDVAEWEAPSPLDPRPSGHQVDTTESGYHSGFHYSYLCSKSSRPDGVVPHSSPPREAALGASWDGFLVTTGGIATSRTFRAGPPQAGSQVDTRFPLWTLADRRALAPPAGGGVSGRTRCPFLATRHRTLAFAWVHWRATPAPPQPRPSHDERDEGRDHDCSGD